MNQALDETGKCILHATARPWLQNAFLLGESQGFREFGALKASPDAARDLGKQPQKGRREALSVPDLTSSSRCIDATKKRLARFWPAFDVFVTKLRAVAGRP
jgi:hypothetical protein